MYSSLLLKCDYCKNLLKYSNDKTRILSQEGEFWLCASCCDEIIGPVYFRFVDLCNACCICENLVTVDDNEKFYEKYLEIEWIGWDSIKTIVLHKSCLGEFLWPSLLSRFKALNSF